MLARWPIRNKLLVGLAILLVIVGTLIWSGIHGLYAYRSLIKSLDWRLREIPLGADVIARVNDLRVSLSEVRGFTERHSLALDHGIAPPPGQWTEREAFRQRLGDVQASLEKYRAQLTETRWEGLRIGDSSQEWDTVRELESTLAQIDDLDRDEAWMLDEVRVDRLGREIDKLQTASGNLLTYVHDDIQVFLDQIKGEYRTLIGLAWTTSVVTTAMLGLFVGFFYQWIFRPLRVLVKGSRKVAGGQFDYLISVGTRDEMQELADAMNAMTARFREIRDDLDHQVQERTKQVVRSEQLASVGFLAAGVAHEINNPLASIALCAESLERRMEELVAADQPDRPVVQNYLRMIQDEAFRCKGITERLLDFSRLGDVKRSSADLGELVQGVIEMVAHLGKYQEKQVVFEPRETISVQVNAQEIKQVVLNLLTNALDSLEAGGQVTVNMARRGGQAELTFRDNGCGMTPEVQQHLFEPFFTRKRGGQGTGLGLSISYRIVTDHGGTIVAASDGPGRGAEFRVTLPLAEAPQEVSYRYQAA